MKPLSVIIQMKATEQYHPGLLFIMLVVIAFKPVDETQIKAIDRTFIYTWCCGCILRMQLKPLSETIQTKGIVL